MKTFVIYKKGKVLKRGKGGRGTITPNDPPSYGRDKTTFLKDENPTLNMRISLVKVFHSFLSRFNVVLYYSFLIF